MTEIAFFDTKAYDKKWFDKLKSDYSFSIRYLEHKLTAETAVLAQGCPAVVTFVNDTLNAEVMNKLYDFGVKIIALRCAGYNNVDFKNAFGRIHIVRVPAYSPYAVAEHAMALLLSLNRKIHRAYNRTREHNYSLDGLIGFDLHGKTAGVVGTGKIGQVFCKICLGFGMKVLAYDPYPADISGVQYVSFPELCSNSDIISLHCPLTKDTHHIINFKSLSLMKKGVYLINTSRGSLIDSDQLLQALKSGRVGASALDVYEEEAELFFEDFSDSVIQDDVLSVLTSLPNVIITSHQAFLTEEALRNIAATTLENLDEYFSDRELTNEICYRCQKYGKCEKTPQGRCF